MKKLAEIWQGENGEFYRVITLPPQCVMYIGVAVKPTNNDSFENRTVIEITPTELAEMLEKECEENKGSK